VLVDMEGYPVAEVARMLACAKGTVKSRCSRGRDRLAGLLRDRLGEARDGPHPEPPAGPPRPIPTPVTGQGPTTGPADDQGGAP
jgi:RNA polymerase sigma-70 factor, ECF subfamily